MYHALLRAVCTIQIEKEKICKMFAENFINLTKSEKLHLSVRNPKKAIFQYFYALHPTTLNEKMVPNNIPIRYPKWTSELTGWTKKLLFHVKSNVQIPRSGN